MKNLLTIIVVASILLVAGFDRAYLITVVMVIAVILILWSVAKRRRMKRNLPNPNRRLG